MPGGLEDVVATDSQICDLDGKLGKLSYFGVDIHDLVAHGSFEETAYLLWHGVLPTSSQLEELEEQLIANRAMPDQLLEVLHILPKKTTAMDVLRTGASLLSAFDPDINDKSTEANRRRAIRLTAVFPHIISAWNHIRNGRDVVAPLKEDSHAANLLYMLFGKQPEAFHTHVMDAALILHADHELNASTFAARVAAGTMADMYAAVTAAIGALSGPLHGGANEQVMNMLLKIGESNKAEGYIKEALARKDKIMGFGHRVYRTDDPRAQHLREFSRELGERSGDPRWYTMSRTIEGVVKEEKGLYSNVDFYSASTYYMLGIPIDLDTPIFATSRITGWTAHILEQYANNRLIRPRAEYVGPKNVTYVPLEQRAQVEAQK